MNAYDVYELHLQLGKRVQSLESARDTRLETFDGQLDGVEEKLSHTVGRFDHLEARVLCLDGSHTASLRSKAAALEKQVRDLTSRLDFHADTIQNWGNKVRQSPFLQTPADAKTERVIENAVFHRREEVAGSETGPVWTNPDYFKAKPDPCYCDACRGEIKVEVDKAQNPPPTTPIPEGILRMASAVEDYMAAQTDGDWEFMGIRNRFPKAGQPDEHQRELNSYYEIFDEQRELLDWAETILCSGMGDPSVRGSDWLDSRKTWRDKKHKCFRGALKNPTNPQCAVDWDKFEKDAKPECNQK